MRAPTGSAPVAAPGQVDRNIAWLLEHGSAPIRYRTNRDLLERDPGSRAMRELFAEVESSAIAREILSKQEPDGSWYAGGSWALAPSYLQKNGYSPVSPKYVTTAWILPLLGDMGFTSAHPAVRRGCGSILAYQWGNGYIGESLPARDQVSAKPAGPASDPMPATPCRFSILLIALGKAGMGEDPRVRSAVDLLLRWQRDDGGWVQDRHMAERNWTRSCPFASFHATAALSSMGRETCREPMLRGLRFLVRHLSTKTPEEISRFFFHGHSPLQELLLMSETGIGLEEDVGGTLLAWLLSMLHPDEGCFRYAGKPASKYSLREDAMDARVARYRLFHQVEPDWLTFYGTKVLKNLSAIGR